MADTKTNTIIRMMEGRTSMAVVLKKGIWKMALCLALTGCIGCSSGKEDLLQSSVDFSGAKVSSEENGEEMEASSGPFSAEFPTISVPEAESGNGTLESLPEMETGTSAASETASGETRSVEPVYFEGDEYDIMSQKLLLGRGNFYFETASDYFEFVQGATDVNFYYYLFRTDEKFYTAEDFAECSDTILKLAKNEIYARHGRMFLDRELYDYFLTRMWYEPKYTPEEFDESCLNEYERANLELLVSLGA